MQSRSGIPRPKKRCSPPPPFTCGGDGRVWSSSQGVVWRFDLLGRILRLGSRSATSTALSFSPMVRTPITTPTVLRLRCARTREQGDRLVPHRTASFFLNRAALNTPHVQLMIKQCAEHLPSGSSHVLSADTFLTEWCVVSHLSKAGCCAETASEHTCNVAHSPPSRNLWGLGTPSVRLIGTHLQLAFVQPRSTGKVWGKTLASLVARPARLPVEAHRAGHFPAVVGVGSCAGHLERAKVVQNEGESGQLFVRIQSPESYVGVRFFLGGALCLFLSQCCSA